MEYNPVLDFLVYIGGVTVQFTLLHLPSFLTNHNSSTLK